MCFWKIWVITIFVYFIIRDLQWCIILYIIVFKFEIICLSKKGVPLSRCQKRRLPGRLWYLFVGCDFFKEVKFWIIHIIVTVFSLSVWIFYSHVLKMLLERFLIQINIIWMHQKNSYETDRYFVLHTYVYSLQLYDAISNFCNVVE